MARDTATRPRVSATTQRADEGSREDGRVPVDEHAAMDDWPSDPRAVRRVQHRPGVPYDAQAWPYQLAPVAQRLDHGLDLPAGVTFLVGENGSGKSTLVEAVAAAAGLNPEGSSHNAQHVTRGSEPGPAAHCVPRPQPRRVVAPAARSCAPPTCRC